MKRPSYRRAVVRWLGVAIATGIGLVGVIVSDWSLIARVLAVLGILLLSFLIANGDYLLGWLMYFWRRLQFLETRVLQLEAQMALALPVRPLAVTGFRQEGQELRVVLGSELPDDLSSEERLIVVDTFGQPKIIARALVCEGKPPTQARLLEVELDFKKALTQRLLALDRSVPEHVVVFRERETSALAGDTGGPRWRSQ